MEGEADWWLGEYQDDRGVSVANEPRKDASKNVARQQKGGNVFCSTWKSHLTSGIPPTNALGVLECKEVQKASVRRRRIKVMKVGIEAMVESEASGPKALAVCIPKQHIFW